MTALQPLIERLRALMANQDAINGLARGPMGYANRRELDAAAKLQVEAVNALPHLLDALEALFARGGVEGMVLVPREPTEGMLTAAARELARQATYLGWEPCAIWSAMIAAAPQSAGEKGEGV